MSYQIEIINGVKIITDTEYPGVPITEVPGDGGKVVAYNAVALLNLKNFYFISPLFDTNGVLGILSNVQTTSENAFAQIFIDFSDPALSVTLHTDTPYLFRYKQKGESNDEVPVINWYPYWITNTIQFTGQMSHYSEAPSGTLTVLTNIFPNPSGEYVLNGIYQGYNRYDGFGSALGYYIYSITDSSIAGFPSYQIANAEPGNIPTDTATINASYGVIGNYITQVGASWISGDLVSVQPSYPGLDIMAPGNLLNGRWGSGVAPKAIPIVTDVRLDSDHNIQVQRSWINLPANCIETPVWITTFPPFRANFVARYNSTAVWRRWQFKVEITTVDDTSFSSPLCSIDTSNAIEGWLVRPLSVHDPRFLF
jgi:hypothetical protein